MNRFPDNRRRPIARILLPLSLLTLAVALPAHAQNPVNTAGVVLPRYPALSPDGKTLVFSYQGDLWSAPSDGSLPAHRLTVHPAYDGPAVFSRDGKQIAFNSDRYGRNEIFVMPADGGEARRLTYYSGGSSVQGWTDNGKRLLLTSLRELQRRGPVFYTIGTGAKPGRPKPLLNISDMLTGELSPDGTRLVFARGSGDWPRRGYHGAANADVWVYTLATKTFKRLTDFDGQDIWPHWLPDGKSVVYVSERDGTYNLYKQAVEGGKPVQITHFKGDGVRFPNVSADGTRAAFEIGDRIATVDLKSASAAPKTVALTVEADDKLNPTVVETLTDGASEIAVSPDGEQIAFVVKGDIFVIGRDGGRAIRLTEAPARDDDLAWSADSKTLVYVSNRDGNLELYSVSSTDPEEPRLSRSLKRTTKRLTNTPEPERAPQFSPDGKKLAYSRGRGDLVVADADGSNARVVLIGTNLGGFVWSPDSRWFALTREDEDFNSDVYLLPADGSKPPVNVSKHPRNDLMPAWSPDGTKLFWASERLDRQFDLYYVYLRKEDDERTPDEWARLRERRGQGRGVTRPSAGPELPAPAGGGTTPPAAPGGVPRRRRAGGENVADLFVAQNPPAQNPPVQAPPGTPPPGPATPGTPNAPAGTTQTPPAATPQATAASTATPITIDFDRIDERVHRLTTLLGNEYNPVTAAGPDGHTLIAFASSASGAPELSLIDFVDGSLQTPTPRRIAAGGASNVQWTRDGRTLFYLTGGGNIATVVPAAGTDPRPVTFRARFSYDRRALQIATFEEAWQTLDQQYYDPKFHGADWAGLRGKYRAMAAAASDPNDFADVIRLMMGHLNSSHIGYTGAAKEGRDDSVPTGALGVLWDESYTGPGLKIGHVIPDSPADRTSTRLRVGEVVTAINGVTLTPEVNPDELLADTVGERTPLSVTGADGKTREVIIEPTTYLRIRSLLYDEWVEQRREMTHKLSDGKLAYLHIQAMDKGSQDRFEQGLYAEAHGRDGLLIDVRDNGGGSTADYLLTMLTIPSHAYTIPRGGVPGYPQDRLPLYPWQKPAALLINQNSYSNAEIFAHAFNTIDRGPIIGTPTFGAVISTGARTLLDGSSIRTPGRGWYNVKTGVNEEHTAAQPDRYVLIAPEDELAGRDPQLEEAVKILQDRAKPRALPAPQPAK